MAGNFIHGVTDDWRIGKTITQCNRYMLENEIDCNVTFIVGEDKIQMSAHKYILIARSEVFEAMFVGPLYERSNIIEIPDVSPSAFKKLLEFMYYDNSRLEEHDAYELLYVSRKYLVIDLVHRCLQRLKTRMSVENVCIILSYADDEGTTNLCLRYIFRYPLEVLKSEGFVQLSSDNIKLIIGSNRLGVTEENIFNAVVSWSEQECIRQRIDVLPENQGTILGDILNLIRYGRMKPEYIFQVCKKYLPVEIYTEVIENIALQTEDERHGNRPEAHSYPPVQHPHERGTCSQEVRPKTQFRTLEHMEVLDSTNIEADGKMDDDHPVSHPVQSVFSRPRDTFTVSRFPRHSFASGKSYDAQTPDSISFLSSERIELDAVLFYGSCRGLGNYQIHLEITEDLGGHLSLIHSSEREIETDSTKPSNEIKLEQSVHIESDRVYTIRALIRGPPSFFGTNGTAEVRRNGVSMFFITNDEFGLNTTTAEGGQFPGLVFEKQT